MLCTKFSLLFPLFHTLGLNIFGTLMQLSWKELSQGGLKQKVAVKDIYQNHRERIHDPDTMNREIAHAAEKSSLYFSSDKLAGQPGTRNSPQTPSSSLPVLPGDMGLLFPALHSPSEALQRHKPKSCRGLWATFLRGLHPSPAGEREEMQAKREELGGGRGRSYAVEHMKMNIGRSRRTVLQERERGGSHIL